MEAGKIFNPYMIFLGSFIPDSVMKDKSISSTAKLCYGRLMRYSGKNGECFPSIDKLSKEIGVERTQTKHAIHILEHYKLIKVTPRAREDGSQTTNKIEFLWHKMFEEIDEEESETRPHPPSEVRPPLGNGNPTPYKESPLLRESLRRTIPNGMEGANAPTNGKPSLLLRR
jgi:DNA-binding transcriptional MocR family regulator